MSDVVNTSTDTLTLHCDELVVVDHTFGPHARVVDVAAGALRVELRRVPACPSIAVRRRSTFPVSAGHFALGSCQLGGATPAVPEVLLIVCGVGGRRCGTHSSSKRCPTTYTYSSHVTRSTASTASSKQSKAARPGCSVKSSRCGSVSIGVQNGVERWPRRCARPLVPVE